MDPDNLKDTGISRKAIEQKLANSLERLGMELVELYQIQRWDADTPIAETLRTLDDTVRRGRVRYVRASMFTYQFAESLNTIDHFGPNGSRRCKITITLPTARSNARYCPTTRRRTSA